jgi:hypothetical protein
LCVVHSWWQPQTMTRVEPHVPYTVVQNQRKGPRWISLDFSCSL